MSIFEYNKEKEEKKLRKAAYEGGREEGRAEGLETGTLITVLKFAAKFSWSHDETVQYVCDLLEVDAKSAERLLAAYGGENLYRAAYEG